MPETLLRTKFFAPPTRPSLVPRLRLKEQLNQGLQLGHKLILISAPAGFGKTTLVSNWLQELPGPQSDIVNHIAWLSLDTADNDPVRFLRYLVTAVCQSIANNSPNGQGMLALLQSPQPPPPEAVLTPLVNELAAVPDRIILILDDYHLIEAQPVHEALSFFLENSPQHIQVVIATREDPLLPLARFRARAQMTEILAADLRFTSSEAADFLNRVMGLDLSPEDIAALETRTEGWITGLQLAAISLQGSRDNSEFIKSFTGSHRYVLDYLIEEVLEQQHEAVQDFLLQTAVLERLTGSLCDALTGREDGQQTLEKLEHANLFIIPLDEERRWYRYHHLFADLLYKRLKQLRANQIPKLHGHASRWFEHNGFDDEAIDHALRGDDFEHAVEMIENHIDDIWGAGQHAMIQSWVAKLPAALVLSKPNLCIFHAWYLFVNGQRDPAEQALTAALRLIELPPDQTLATVKSDQAIANNPNRKTLQGRAAAVQAFMASYQGDLAGIIQYARRAYDCLPEKDLTWRCLTAFVLGDALLFQGDMSEAHRVRRDAVRMSEESGHFYLILIAHLRLAETLRHQGKLPEARTLCQEQMQFVKQCGIEQTVAAGWLFALWGDMLAESNDLDGAIKQVRRGVKLAGHGGRDVAFFAWSNLYFIRVLFSRGELSEAEAVIEKMQIILRERDMPILVPNQISAWQARIWLAQDKTEEASQWVEARELEETAGELSFLRESEYVVLARILIAKRQFHDAARLLNRLLEAAIAGGRNLRVIELLLLKSLAAKSRGDTARAMATLEQAIALGRAGDFIRIFADEGPPLAQLLRDALERDIAPVYVRQLLATFPAEKPLPAVSTTLAPDQGGLIEPLSEREIEVLQHIAAGFTNPEIADRLYLSLNTVKVHTRNIYGKLGVHNRTTAVARARALGILPVS